MNRTKTLAVTGIFTALVTVATIVLQIPMPSTNGYVNFGDTIIFIAAVLFGPIVGGVAGGLGSALADLITGYAYYAPFTLVIKGLEGLLCGLILKALFKKRADGGITKVFSLVAMITASIIMVAGYYLAGIVLTGSAAASLASVPGNLIQGSVSTLCAYLILFALKIADKIIKKR